MEILKAEDARKIISFSDQNNLMFVMQKIKGAALDGKTSIEVNKPLSGITLKQLDVLGYEVEENESCAIGSFVNELPYFTITWEK